MALHQEANSSFPFGMHNESGAALLLEPRPPQISALSAPPLSSLEAAEADLHDPQILCLLLNGPALEQEQQQALTPCLEELLWQACKKHGPKWAVISEMHQLNHFGLKSHFL